MSKAGRPKAEIKKRKSSKCKNEARGLRKGEKICRVLKQNRYTSDARRCYETY